MIKIPVHPHVTFKSTPECSDGFIAPLDPSGPSWALVGPSAGRWWVVPSPGRWPCPPPGLGGAPPGPWMGPFRSALEAPPPPPAPCPTPYKYVKILFSTPKDIEYLKMDCFL